MDKFIAALRLPWGDIVVVLFVILILAAILWPACQTAWGAEFPPAVLDAIRGLPPDVQAELLRLMSPQQASWTDPKVLSSWAALVLTCIVNIGAMFWKFGIVVEKQSAQQRHAEKLEHDIDQIRQNCLERVGRC